MKYTILTTTLAAALPQMNMQKNVFFSTTLLLKHFKMITMIDVAFNRIKPAMS